MEHIRRVESSQNLSASKAGKPVTVLFGHLKTGVNDSPGGHIAEADDKAGTDNFQLLLQPGLGRTSLIRGGTRGHRFTLF